MLHLVISSADQQSAYENVTSLTCQVSSGEIEILPGHSEAFFQLLPGKIQVTTPNGVQEIEIPESVCHIQNDVVHLIYFR